MTIDLIIVLLYFIVVFTVAIRGRQGKEVSSEEYFLSNRNLPWYSIAISTIATNVQGYQFLGMMGSAYLFGLAQANFEINAIQGLWMAAFIFVPLYLKERVITITQFIQKRLGKTVGLFYSLGNLLLFATIGLGAALFWGAYAAEKVFGEYLYFISDSQMIRVSVLIVFLGIFSATYTYFGGLSAVVRTDLIQFVILTIGGFTVLYVSIKHLGGWGKLYELQATRDLMHLHLPADHKTLPWVGMIGLLFMNINYWCANQVVMQRSLAARSLKDAQIGLMVGGLMKYVMAVIIIVPGIALVGILADNPLTDPDSAYPFVVKNYLPTGVRGLILCALFASLMSTVDSLFNSLATLWSIDIYKGYLKKDATDAEVVQTGRRTILVTFMTGILMGFAILYYKLADPNAAFTHSLNALRYFFNTGFVVVILASAFLIIKREWVILTGFLMTGTMYALSFFIYANSELNYLIRAMIVIMISLSFISILAISKEGFRSAKEYYKAATPQIGWFGLAMLASLVALHIIFH